MKPKIILVSPNPWEFGLTKSDMYLSGSEYDPTYKNEFGTRSFVIKDTVFTYYCTTGWKQDESIEKNKIELERLKKFLGSIDAKLGNQNFIKNAKPEIIQREEDKRKDTISKIDHIEKLLGI